MKRSTVASLIGLVFTSPTFAAETINLDDIVVSSNRFSESNASSATNIKIINKEEILNSPAISIPDVLRMQAGLNITSLYGNQGIDASIDSRGFGDAGLSNTLILLDGQRLNTIDSSSIQWASIPLAAIDHIEIISGGGSVLYGDRAAGGVINIITDKSGKSAASLTAGIGSYGYKSLDGYASEGSENLYFNTFAHTSDSNGWRKNSANKQWALSGSGGLLFNAGDAFVDYSVYHAENGQPGSVTIAQLQNNPRIAIHPLDSQVKDGFRIRPGFKTKLADNIEFAAEMSLAEEKQHVDILPPSSPRVLDRNLNTYSFTPRLKWAHGLGALSSTSVFGVDFYKGQVEANNNGTDPNVKANQNSQAIYLQNITSITKSLDFSSGLRLQRMRQQADQAAFSDWGAAEVTGSAVNTKTAYDLGLSYHQTSWSTYAKIGSSFRFANTDELLGYNDYGDAVFTGNIIKPQTAINKEIGVAFNQNNIDGKLALYHMDLKNEISFLSTLSQGYFFGSNINLDPTTHQGLEAEFGWQIISNIKAKFSYAFTDAKFKSSTYEGKLIPSVPTNTAHTQILWDTHQYGKYVAQLNYVGQRYISGDFTNTVDKLPSYTTLDLRANWDLKPIILSLSALNVTNKIYSPYAVLSSQHINAYYPADSRAIYFSARYDFK